MRPQALIVRRGGGSSSGGGSATPTVSLTPVDGVEYTSGIADLDAETMNLIAQTISNNSEISTQTYIIYFSYGNLNRRICIGDQINLSLNGTDYAFDLIGFNHDSLSNDSAYGAVTATGKAGMTLQMHNVYTTVYAMKNQYWYSSSNYIRSSILPLLKSYLAEDWQELIKPVLKYTYVGSTGSGYETTDGCFLLGNGELDPDSNERNYNKIYAYYLSGNSRVKYTEGTNTAKAWWLRTKHPNANLCISIDRTGATVGTNVSTALGVSFAFCI